MHRYVPTEEASAIEGFRSLRFELRIRGHHESEFEI